VGSSNRLTVDVIRGIIVVVVVMSIGLAVVGPVLLPVVFGSPYDTGYPALLVLLLASIPLSYGRLLSGDIKGRGRPGLVSLASMVGVPITIIGDLLLVPRFGIVAAAVVSLVAYGTTAVTLAHVYRHVSGIRALELVPSVGDVGLVGRQMRNAGRRLARSSGPAEPGDRAEPRP
jgi:O-antigen/teichoic acid export membrane protein